MPKHQIEVQTRDGANGLWKACWGPGKLDGTDSMIRCSESTTADRVKIIARGSDVALNLLEVKVTGIAEGK